MSTVADTTPRDLQHAVAQTFHAVTHADQDTLEAVLAELEADGDTPIFDQLADMFTDPMPEHLIDRILDAPMKETSA